MPNLIAPPFGLVLIAESLPCIVSYNFQAGGLTPAGVTNVLAAVGTYLNASKLVAIGAEQARVGGTTTVPAAIIGAKSGSFPLSWADANTQGAALVTLIGTPGNA